MKNARRSLLLLAAAGLLASAGQAGEIAVRVSESSRRVYELEGRFEVSAPSSVVWDVLADYDGIDEFVPSVIESRLVHRRAGAALIEQRMAGKALIFSREVELTLEVREVLNERIAFQDVSQRDFSQYAGEWRLAAAGGGTAVTYRLTASPRFTAPDFLTRGAFKRGVRELLEEVRREILRRAQRTEERP